jgi:hypothetical protein
MRPGEGRECTLHASLSSATGADYDDLMGASGAAFTTAIDAATWDPIAAAPLDEATLARAARAAGVRVDRVTPPYDDELRELVRERIVEAIEAKVPPLVKGAVGPAEFGLIVGYDLGAPDTPTFLVRTYFDRGDEPTRLGWDAFAGEGHGEPYFLDPAQRPTREVLVRDAVALGSAAADESDRAMAAWLAGLRDEERWKADPRHTGALVFADHAMRTILADKRRSAGRWLRSARGAVEPRVAADLLRAAESYGHVADAADKAGSGAFDPATVMRFVEGGARRAWANLLEGALKHERDAHEALRSAHAALK